MIDWVMASSCFTSINCINTQPFEHEEKIIILSQFVSISCLNCPFLFIFKYVNNIWKESKQICGRNFIRIVALEIIVDQGVLLF